MPNRIDSSLASAIEAAPGDTGRLQDGPAASAGDLVAEHILLSGDDWEPSPRAYETDPRLLALSARFVISNRLRRSRTELKLYEQGYLGVREHRRHRSSEERVINLRYVDLKPAISRFLPRRSRKAGLWSMACAGAAGALAYAAVWPKVTVPVTLVLAAAATVSWLLFACRLREQVVFRTQHGRANVLKLIANLGCIKACRTCVPRLVGAVRDARQLAAEDKHRRLREEMHEHYRLRDSGVISPEVCTAATRRILAAFD